MKPRFVFSRSQRTGVLGLILVIAGFSGVMVWLDHQSIVSPKPPGLSKEEKQVQHFVDSLKSEKSEETDSFQIYPFNPNFISDYKGYRLGMHPEEIDRLHKFRERGQWVNSTVEFQDVTEVSDSLLDKISPYFKFPDWVQARRKDSVNAQTNLTANNEPKADLNGATVEDLQKIRGIGEVLSHRITRYRAKIDGFVDGIQLKDVYGLDYEVRDNLLEKFKVKENSKVEKININKANMETLSDVVYFDYELARRIVNYRITHEGIESFEELAKIKDFPIGRLDRVKLYLKIGDFEK